jgi:protein-disulfide isomerase
MAKHTFHPEISMNNRIISKAVSTIVASVFILVASIMTTPVFALDAAQKSEFEALIRSYLLKNPEILVEAQEALEKKRALEASLKIKRTLSEKSALIFNSKNQFEIGNPDADVVVVEFFDYNCSFCKRAMNDMNKLLKEDTNLKFVLKELPILSEGSISAHKISTAVGHLEPDRYEEFHNKLLGSNGQKNDKRALKLADSMGLDIKKILAYSKKDSVIDGFREVNSLANDLGMNGTPSYVIGDEVIFGALGYDVLKTKIDKLRECGGTTTSC